MKRIVGKRPSRLVARLSRTVYRTQRRGYQYYRGGSQTPPVSTRCDKDGINTRYCVLTTQTANDCTGRTAWRPWARRRRRPRRRPATLRATPTAVAAVAAAVVAAADDDGVAAGHCCSGSRVRRTTVWVRPASFSGFPTRLQRTHVFRC